MNAKDLFVKPLPIYAGSKANCYVTTTMLEAVTDPLEARSVWSRGWRFWSKQRVLDVIKAQRYPVSDSGLRVCGHVELELPAQLVDYDRKATRGARCRALEAELARRHQAYFSRELGGVPVRYQVKANASLPNNCLRVRTGPGVHVANVESVAHWALEVSADNGVNYSPAGTLFSEGMLLVLGGDPLVSSVLAIAWPFDNSVSLVVMDDPEQNGLDVSVEPYGALRVEPVAQADSSQLLFRVWNPEMSDAPYLLRARRLSGSHGDAGRHQPTTTHRERPATRMPQSPLESFEQPMREPHIGDAQTNCWTADDELGATFFPVPDNGDLSVGGDSLSEGSIDHTIFMAEPDTSVMPGLALAGLAVPQPGHCGARRLSFGFMTDGRIAAAGEKPWLILHATQQAHGAILSVETLQGARTIDTNEDLPLGANAGLSLRLDPPDLDHYVALIMFAPGPICTLPATGQVSFGRTEQGLGALRVLQGSSIELENGRKRSGEDLLSRHHFDIGAHEEGGARVFAKRPILHLDADMRLLGQVESATEIRILPGEHIVAGPYLLRLDL